MVRAEEDAEHRLAVLTNWGLFGAFAIAFLTSGFSGDDYRISLVGYAVMVVGFVGHVIINWVYRTSFRNGEITAAFGLFGFAVLLFMAAWLFSDDFSRADVYSGLTGFVLTVGGFLAYVTTRYGLRGSFSMFHTQRH